MIYISNSYYSYVFSPNNSPAAYCKSGDLVCFETKDCYDGQITKESDVIEVLDTSHCNPATGPLYVEGAKQNDALKVTILDIEVADKGVMVNYPSCGTKLDNNHPKTKIFTISNGKTIFNDIELNIKPMIGVIGTALKDKDIPTGHVFCNGGNMDSRLNSKGAIIYLPVCVDGGLLSIGDLHALMGDGEMVGTGIEVAGKVTVKVEVIKDVNLNWPITDIDNYWFINICGKTCDEAIGEAYRQMHRLLVKNYGFNETDAAMYMSLVGRLEASQACLSSEGGGNSFRIGTPKIPNKSLI